MFPADIKIKWLHRQYIWPKFEKECHGCNEAESQELNQI